MGKEWVKQLRMVIDESKKLKKDQTSLDKKTYFWKFDAISEQQFIQLSDTGDILLFRCRQFGSKITRTFTNSHFGKWIPLSSLFLFVDHVAMVLKFESDPDEVYFVESTSNRGVSISRWSTVRKYLGDFYEQVVLRHLNINRNEEMIARLEIFLQEAVGNRYGMSTSKLLFHR